VLSWKFPKFYSVSGTRSKNSIFAFLGYPSIILRIAYRKQFYPKPMVPMESWDSEGVPYASLHGDSVSRHLGDIGPWRMPKRCHVTITKVENLHTAHVEKFTDSKNAILFDLWREMTKLSQKTRLDTVQLNYF